MLNLSSPLPLSLYIHLPWCVRKCPYCDFNSHEYDGNLRDIEYIDALIRDLEQTLPLIWGRRIVSVFIGGGTPSLFSVEAIEKLFSQLRALLNIGSDIEITMEANPGTAEAEKFIGFREIGINRLSIGVQSFNNEQLKKLGRIHNNIEALNAIELAKQAGFENFNLDLMFALPAQTQEEALADLQLAIDQAPNHISWYQLTLEPNTVFYAKPPELPGDDQSWEIQQAGKKVLTETGYEQYEISAYAKQSNYAKHNLNYWQFGDYLGIGAGAHSKLTDVAKGTITRYTKHKIPKRYLELAGQEEVITETRKLNREELPLEFMLNAMRLSAGLPADYYKERTGLLLSGIEKQLQTLEEKELINWTTQILAPSQKGQRFLNDLLLEFM